MKQYLLWAFGFGMAGSLLMSWLAPSTITWFYQSPVTTGLDCTPALAWAMSLLLKFQTGGTILFGVLGMLVPFAISRRKASKAESL